MIKIDKVLEDAFSNIDFDQYTKAYEFEKARDEDEEARILEEAFNNVSFEEYTVPITSNESSNSSCSCEKCTCNNDYVDFDTVVSLASVMFSPEVIEEGETYYHLDKVLSVYRDKNTFYAKVLGDEGSVYKVLIEFVSHEELRSICDCPCDGNCKHEYAVMCAILNEEYTNISLKEFVNTKDIDVYDLLSKIPAEEFKSYCLNEGTNNVAIEETLFKSFFKKYMPTPCYKYYYNNLYNNLLLQDNVSVLLEEYYEAIKDFVDSCNFKEVIKILKAIVDAFKDSGNINTVSFINVIRDITMFYRVTYNNVSEFDKNELEKWIYEMSSKNYYNNYYLQDMIRSNK